MITRFFRRRSTKEGLVAKIEAIKRELHELNIKLNRE